MRETNFPKISYVLSASTPLKILSASAEKNNNQACGVTRGPVFFGKVKNMNLVERFLKYVSFETTSYEDVDTFPTSPKVFELADYLVEELKGIGLTDAMRDEYGYVYAHLEATPGVEADTIGLMSHMDTSSAVSGADIKPRILKYEGGDIQLNPGAAIKVEDFPDLDLAYKAIDHGHYQKSEFCQH
jgi:hypothetical protein